MAKTDWSSVAAQYQSAYAKTGISPKAWCEQHGLNYQSARRYIKASDAQADDKIAQPSVRKIVRNYPRATCAILAKLRTLCAMRAKPKRER
jgi:hypothetical protein